MTVCIPEAGGVPGLGNQPPTWPEIAPITGNHVWPRGAPSTSTPVGLDDPRWRGGMGLGFPDAVGGTEAAGFRAIYDNSGGQKSLYLSWWIRADTGDPTDDRLYVGFERSPGLDPIVLRIIPFSGPPPLATFDAATISIFRAPAGGGASGPVQNWTENGGATPSWLADNTHVWLHSGLAWAVQMRVPIDSGSVDTHLDLPDTFKFWFEMRVDPAAGMAIPHRYPRTAAPTTIPVATINVPTPANWEDFHLSTGPGDPTCPTTGFVSISSIDIGTQNTPASRIEFTAAPAPNVEVNVFEAKPENKTGAAIPAGGVEAEFRIANWGSTIGPAATWDKVPATGGTNPTTNTAPIANGTKANSITMEWQLNNAERTAYSPGGSKLGHQCLLVSLTGAGLQFNPASVYRNMDFAPASTFEREAEISNVGMEARDPGGGIRPAYILIEKLNMPDGSEPGRDEGGGDGGFRPRRVAHGQEAPDPDLGAIHKEQQTELDRLHAGEPTIRYHVFHDTGETVIDDDGNEDRVLAAGIPFGYFMQHDGPVERWSDEIHGATQIAERLWELQVPVEGAERIVTVVQAHERGDPGGQADGGGQQPEPQGCMALIAKLLARLRKLLGG